MLPQLPRQAHALPQAKTCNSHERSEANAASYRKTAPPLQQDLGKNAGIRCEGCPSMKSMAPPCYRATRAREPERVWEWPIGYGLAAEYVPAARLRCTSLSARSPYHTHRHEPIKYLDQAPRLVVAAVARHVTAEISDVAGKTCRPRQRPSKAGGVYRPNGGEQRQPSRRTVAAYP